MKPRTLALSMLLLSFIGIADAAYLTQSAYTGTPLSCDLGAGLDGCNVVAQSPYSHLFGVPLALYGVLFYGAFFFLAALYLWIRERRIALALYVLGIAGLLSSLLFIGMQLMLIKAVCLYCFGSALVSLLLFLATYFLHRTLRGGPAKPPVVTPWEDRAAVLP